MGKSTAYQRRMARIQILSPSMKVRPHMPATHHWGGAKQVGPRSLLASQPSCKRNSGKFNERHTSKTKVGNGRGSSLMSFSGLLGNMHKHKCYTHIHTHKRARTHIPCRYTRKFKSTSYNSVNAQQLSAAFTIINTIKINNLFFPKARCSG